MFGLTGLKPNPILGPIQLQSLQIFDLNMFNPLTQKNPVVVPYSLLLTFKSGNHFPKKIFKPISEFPRKVFFFFFFHFLKNHFLFKDNLEHLERERGNKFSRENLWTRFLNWTVKIWQFGNESVCFCGKENHFLEGKFPAFEDGLSRKVRESERIFWEKKVKESIERVRESEREREIEKTMSFIITSH